MLGTGRAVVRDRRHPGRRSRAHGDEDGRILRRSGVADARDAGQRVRGPRSRLSPRPVGGQWHGAPDDQRDSNHWSPRARKINLHWYPRHCLSPARCTMSKTSRRRVFWRQPIAQRRVPGEVEAGAARVATTAAPPPTSATGDDRRLQSTEDCRKRTMNPITGARPLRSAIVRGASRSPRPRRREVPFRTGERPRG